MRLLKDIIKWGTLTGLHYRHDFHESEGAWDVWLDTSEMLGKLGVVLEDVQIEHDCISGIISFIHAPTVFTEDRIQRIKELVALLERGPEHGVMDGARYRKVIEELRELVNK